MSFSGEIKKELSKLNNLANKRQVKHELIGYLITNNISSISAKKLGYSTENEYNINRFSKLLDNLDINHEISIDGNIFVIDFRKEDILNFSINDLEIEDKKAIVRGAFMGAGTISNPKRTYHLEIIFSKIEHLKKLMKILEELEIKAKELISETKMMIYIKEGEEISKFLALIGANKGVLEFENIRVEKQMKSKVNRLVNCETANLNKTINCSVMQIEAIEKLKKENRFNKLDEGLKEIAKVRIKYPDIPLSELGKKLEKPLGKSGVNYRLKKIIDIANMEGKNDGK